MEWSRWAVPAFALSVLSTSAALASAGALTEAEAIRIFLESSPHSRLVPAIERAVDAGLRVETRVDDPELSYQLEDAAGVRDEFWSIEQSLPISGRRGLLEQRATTAATAAALGARATLRADVYALKDAFHDVLYRERVLRLLQEGDARLVRTVEILELRESEGEGSGYDVLRAEQELADLQMTIADADAALAAARSRLGSFFDPESKIESASLTGDDDTSGPMPDLETAVEIAFEQRLELRSLSVERQGLELERRAARRRRFPEPVVSAGWKRSEALGQSDTGYLAAVTIPLPLFDRGRLASARAAADGQRVELEAEILTRRIRADVQAALAREQASRRISEAYGTRVAQRADELNDIARIKYDEGESGILELLDAQRTSLSMQLRALAARHDAKLAEIDRHRVLGDEVQP